MTSRERIEAFVADLGEISRRHGVAIDLGDSEAWSFRIIAMHAGDTVAYEIDSSGERTASVSPRYTIVCACDECKAKE